jgi:hypothetical protein
MDFFGAFFSLMALGRHAFECPSSLLAHELTVAQHTFDILGGILYIIWLVTARRYEICRDGIALHDLYISHASSCLLEIGIFLSHIIWLARTRKLRKEAAADGKTFDEVAAQYEANGIPFRFAERKSKGKVRAEDPETGEAATDGTDDVKNEQQLQSPVK